MAYAFIIVRTMQRKRKGSAFLLLGAFFVLFATLISNHSQLDRIRTVDIVTIFAAGVVFGAALVNVIILVGNKNKERRGQN
jgi:uncharacterized membrane protein